MANPITMTRNKICDKIKKRRVLPVVRPTLRGLRIALCC